MILQLSDRGLPHVWPTKCRELQIEALPASAPKGSEDKSNIPGKESDNTPKTPEWASRITQVPVDTIERLANEIGTTKPCFTSQGRGPQRRMKGETQSTAIAMQALLTGHVDSHRHQLGCPRR